MRSAAVFVVSQASASIMYGVAVDPADNSVVAASLQSDTSGTGPNDIEYFIPLSGSTVTYGVTGGTSPDTGSGIGYDTAGALDMYLKYDLSSFVQTVIDVEVDFNFVDLDLIPVNDPVGFYESIKFTVFDKNNAPLMLTNVIQDIDSPGPSAAGTTMTITYGGNNDPININFKGSALDTLVDDLLGAGATELIALVQYGSQYHSSATNTSEFAMSSTIGDSSGVTPEPTTLAIWSVLAGMGLLAAGRQRERKAA